MQRFRNAPRHRALAHRIDDVRRLLLVPLAALLLLGVRSDGTRLPPPPETSVLQFATPPIDDRLLVRRPLTAESVDRLKVMWDIKLPEIADGSPLFVANVDTDEGRRDMVIVETMIGRVVALNAHTGDILWLTAPPYGPRWTTSSPAVDPLARFVFAYCLDGRLHKYAIEDGQEIGGGGWPVLVTKKGDVEKGSSNITIATARNGHTFLYMTIAAYPEPGDDGDYQGHLVTVDIDSGAKHIFNALCSDRETIFDASGGKGDCAQRQAGIWARTSAVYDSVTDRIFVTTGNGTFDGDRAGFNWGSSVVALRPDGLAVHGVPLDSYTPLNFQQLTDDDLDLSSTAVAVLPIPRVPHVPRVGVQSGKDGLMRLLNLENLSGGHGPRHLGGELQVLPVPQGGQVLTRPAAWFDTAKEQTWLFVANDRGVSGFRAETVDGVPQLVPVWMTKDVQGTSPILANGMLFVATSNAIRALDPGSGNVLWQDTAIGDVHWQSPIVVNRQVFLPDHNGHLYAWEMQ